MPKFSRALLWLPVIVVACGGGSPAGFDAPARNQTTYTEPGVTVPPPGNGFGGGASDGSAPTADAGTCAAEVKSADKPKVDIVVVIDNSGSMVEETNQVRVNINDFAQKIGNSGLDYQVVMLSNRGTSSQFFMTAICVPPPLGGLNCADNPPRFHHVQQSIDSHDALSQILGRYPTYRPWLRADAYKVFIVITDDSSALEYDDFDRALLALQPAGMFGTAQARKYIFDSICGWKEGTAYLSNDECSSAENPGTDYQRLSVMTGGIVDSVCKQSYANVFDNIAKGLVQKLGCEFQVPQPASGQIDPKTVAVHYTKGGTATPQMLVQVTDASKCGSVADAWYYDNNESPTKILFCPALCDVANKDADGNVQIALGCKVPPPR